MNNTNYLDNFFSFVSKAVIIIPIIILVSILFLKFSTSKKNPSLSNLVVPTVSPAAKKDSFKFDLQGPIMCDNLFIKNKKILLKNRLINYLLNGDCLYIWEEGKGKGEKKCGLSVYMGLAENYLRFLNVDDITNNNLVNNYIKDKNIDLISIVKSCKRQEIKANSIFEVPTKILF